MYIGSDICRKVSDNKMSEFPTIIDKLHNLMTRDRFKKNIEDYLKTCRLLYPGRKHGGWESVVLSSILFELAENLNDCRTLFSLKSVPFSESQETEQKIIETYMKILNEPVQKKMGTEIDALVTWSNQQCLIEHETHWKSLSLPIIQIYRVYDLLRIDTDLFPSCVFITHAPIHKYDVNSNPITKLIQYTQACESLFDKSRWAIVNIWEMIFDWRLEKIDIWWIPQDLSISRLQEKEEESKIPSFWRNLGRL